MYVNDFLVKYKTKVNTTRNGNIEGTSTIYKKYTQKVEGDV